MLVILYWARKGRCITNAVWEFPDTCASELLYYPALTAGVALEYSVHGHYEIRMNEIKFRLGVGEILYL